MTGAERIHRLARHLGMDVIGEPVYIAGAGWTVHVRRKSGNISVTDRLGARNIGGTLQQMRNLSADALPTEPRVNT